MIKYFLKLQVIAIFKDSYFCIYKEEMKDKKSSKKSSKSSSRFQTKFWLVTLVLILGPAVLIARSPIFQLNLNKPFNANYIQ